MERRDERDHGMPVPQGCAENMRWVALQQKVPLFDRFSIGDGTT
jgi:hypothetical protein